MFPNTNSQIKALQGIENSIPNIEILKRSRNLNDTTDILLAKDQLIEVKKIVEKEGITYQVKDNYGRYNLNLEYILFIIAPSHLV